MLFIDNKDSVFCVLYDSIAQSITERAPQLRLVLKTGQFHWWLQARKPGLDDNLPRNLLGIKL